MLWCACMMVSLVVWQLSFPLVKEDDSPSKTRLRVRAIAKCCAIIFAVVMIITAYMGSALMDRAEVQQRTEVIMVAIQKTDFDTCSDEELRIIAQEVARINDEILLHKKYDTALFSFFYVESYGESYDVIKIQNQRLSEEVNKYSNREEVKTKWKKVTYKGDTPIEIDGEEID